MPHPDVWEGRCVMRVPSISSRQFVEMLHECDVTHVWLVAHKPPKGFRPGVDPSPKPAVKFINAEKNLFLPAPRFLAAFVGSGPYAEQGRLINELKRTVYDLDSLQKALSVKWAGG